MLVVPEVLGHRQRRMAHAEPGARRFVHLPVHHHHVWQYARCLHVTVKFLAFATSFTYPAEDADALLVLDHVVNHLREQYGLAHTRPTEEPGLAAALQRDQHVDDLDPSLEDLGLRGAPCHRRRGPVDSAPLDICRRLLAIDSVPEDIEHSRERSHPDWRFQWSARVFHCTTAHQTLGGRQRDSTRVMGVELG